MRSNGRERHDDIGSFLTAAERTDARGVHAGAETLANAESHAQSASFADRPGNSLAANNAADGLSFGALQHRTPWHQGKILRSLDDGEAPAGQRTSEVDLRLFASDHAIRSSR